MTTTTTTAALAAVAALGLAACASDGEPGKAIAKIADTVDTTAPATATRPAPTLPPTTAPPAPAPAVDDFGRDDLFFEFGALNLVGYCYSNCEPIFLDRLERYTALVGDADDFDFAIGFFNDQYPPSRWHELDALCDSLFTAGFDTMEEIALDNNDTSFSQAMAYMTAITLVCDS